MDHLDVLGVWKWPGSKSSHAFGSLMTILSGNLRRGLCAGLAKAWSLVRRLPVTDRWVVGQYLAETLTEAQFGYG
ncbi:MAG: hypothetical protein AAFS10_06240 [Myxococcota bacterium]